ncbi:MAG: hypothetical protein K0S12_1440 [Bacteroidetes bacterium]|jgi:hypothetical protein|nr:hypothetical protein [Bacteroidota bacterium]
MRKPARTRSQSNIDTKDRRRATRTSDRSQRGTSRGSERAREYRGEAREDFRQNRDYDAYDRDLSRHNNDYDRNSDYDRNENENYTREEYAYRGGNNRRRDYEFEDEDQNDQYSGRHRRHEWDEGFGEFDDYDEYEEEYPENYGMSDEMEDRRYDDLYRGRLKRRNTPRGFSNMSLREVQDRGRNSARRNLDIIPAHWSSSGSFDRNRQGIRGRRRSGGAYHTDDDIQYAAPIGYEKDTQRRDYGPGEYEARRRTSRQERIDSERRTRKNISERGARETTKSKLGNSAPGSRITDRRAKTRKKSTQYVSVVDTTPVVTKSKRRGSTSGKRANKSKTLKNA